MQVAILAGGLGTRLSPLTLSVPKPMVPIRGRPFLEYQIEWIRRDGFNQILLLVGYLAEQIERHFSDGSRWGVSISYSHEASPMGTAGALKKASRHLKDPFLLLNGDTYLPMDYGKFAKRFREVGTTGLIAAYDNSQLVAPNNVRVSSEGLAVRFDKSDPGEMTHVDAGAYLFRKRVLDRIPAGRPASLEGDVLPKMASDQDLTAYPIADRYYDIGTFERLTLAENALR